MDSDTRTKEREHVPRECMEEMDQDRRGPGVALMVELRPEDESEVRGKQCDAMK